MKLCAGSPCGAERLRYHFSGTDSGLLAAGRQLTMSNKLNLFEHLLARARQYKQTGRHLDAMRALNRLSAYADMPETVTEQAHALLGELHLRKRHYRRAR